MKWVQLYQHNFFTKTLSHLKKITFCFSYDKFYGSKTLLKKKNCRFFPNHRVVDLERSLTEKHTAVGSQAELEDLNFTNHLNTKCLFYKTNKKILTKLDHILWLNLHSLDMYIALKNEQTTQK